MTDPTDDDYEPKLPPVEEMTEAQKKELADRIWEALGEDE